MSSEQWDSAEEADDPVSNKLPAGSEGKSFLLFLDCTLPTAHCQLSYLCTSFR